MVLTEARLGGRAELTVTKPLVLSHENKNTADYDYLLQNGILPKEYFI